MGDLDLDQIRARAEAATAGPWWAWDRGVGWEIALGDPTERPERFLPDGTREGTLQAADAEFIAQARSDIPALIAEVERLRADVEGHKENRLVAAIFACRDGEAPRPFSLYRHRDETGVSGTGVVAYGCQFADGKVVTRWAGASTDVRQTCVWDSIEDVERVHGHGGQTRVVWLSEPWAAWEEVEQERDRLRAEVKAKGCESCEPHGGCGG